MDRVRGVRDGRGGVLDCARGDAGNIILEEGCYDFARVSKLQDSLVFSERGKVALRKLREGSTE